MQVFFIGFHPSTIPDCLRLLLSTQVASQLELIKGLGKNKKIWVFRFLFYVSNKAFSICDAVKLNTGFTKTSI
jgi:hypothetical protein